WFEVQYTSNESSWKPYAAMRQLSAMENYLQDQGIRHISDLPHSDGSPPPQLRLQTIDFAHIALITTQNTVENSSVYGYLQICSLRLVFNRNLFNKDRFYETEHPTAMDNNHRNAFPPYEFEDFHTVHDPFPHYSHQEGCQQQTYDAPFDLANNTTVRDLFPALEPLPLGNLTAYR
ncbi:hypothetical protein M422DRAFT_179948, partial [Sphaerobolus stellatus SS14]